MYFLSNLSDERGVGFPKGSKKFIPVYCHYFGILLH